MKILSHRGYWEQKNEKNTIQALMRALDSGYGIETDIRDDRTRIVISHNPADENSHSFSAFLREAIGNGNQGWIAINIKSDGLAEKLREELERYKIRNYFCFDMSVPQMIEYAKYGLTFFTRQSEYESEPLPLYEKAAGVWMDAFLEDAWMTGRVLERHLGNGKKICIVSPELHQRPYLPAWERLKRSRLDQEDIFLCTDIPQLADDYFNEGKKNA